MPARCRGIRASSLCRHALLRQSFYAAVRYFSSRSYAPRCIRQRQRFRPLPFLPTGVSHADAAPRRLLTPSFLLLLRTPQTRGRRHAHQRRRAALPFRYTTPRRLPDAAMPAARLHTRGYMTTRVISNIMRFLQVTPRQSTRPAPHHSAQARSRRDARCVVAMRQMTGRTRRFSPVCQI